MRCEERAGVAAARGRVGTGRKPAIPHTHPILAGLEHHWSGGERDAAARGNARRRPRLGDSPCSGTRLNSRQKTMVSMTCRSPLALALRPFELSFDGSLSSVLPQHPPSVAALGCSSVLTLCIRPLHPEVQFETGTYLGARDTNARLYADEWANIAARDARFNVTYALSREQTDAGGDKMYVQA